MTDKQVRPEKKSANILKSLENFKLITLLVNTRRWISAVSLSKGVFLMKVYLNNTVVLCLTLLALAESFTQGQKIVLEVIQGTNLGEQSNMKKRGKKMLEVTPRTIGTESAPGLGND
jgi:hypothetical protein